MSVYYRALMPVHSSESSPNAGTDPNGRELGRLAIMQDDPRRFGERRTEHVELRDHRHFSLRVEHQFVVPVHGEPTESAGTSPRDLLIPLGEFAKARLPELVVTGPRGDRLPVASRAARGKIVATLFTSKWQHVLFDDLEDAERSTAKELWEVVQVSIAHIVTQPSTSANEILRSLHLFLNECSEIAAPGPLSKRIEKLQCDVAFRVGLKAFVDKRLLVAHMRGRPGNTYVVSITYTEAMQTDSYGSGPVRSLLAWLGLVAMPISRQAANSGKAASFWTVASAPPGIEILRLFWQNERDALPTTPSISVDSDRAVIGRYEWSSDKAEDNELIFDVQVAPSAAIASTIGLAAILLFISRQVYEGFPHASGLEERTALLALGTILVTIPATIAGALAYKGELFTRYVSRGPRVMVALLSVLGAVLALGISLKALSSTFTEIAACISSVYCVVIIGVFGYIRVGFRWRHNDAARLLRWRKPKSPDRSRQTQTRLAVGYFAFLVVVVIAFTKCQIGLQHRHFFTRFPHEIDRELSSW
jgi:hypothetical protein